jgi:hypothetical protein
VTNAQLVVSHGCRPFTHGAWCSPGFWGNATLAAWTLIGVDRATAVFGSTVAVDPNFVATNTTAVSALSSTLLYTILTATGGTYKGADIGTFRTFSANAFNLTGAWLTDQIPGFDFDASSVTSDDSQTCPIDHFGHFKTP